MISKKIVAIGGGEIDNLETFEIDKRIVELANKPRPKLLFIPTASRDSTSYYTHIQKVFGDRLNCRTDVLYLSHVKKLDQDMIQKILNVDIIYVGGGNTLYMMNTWRRLGVNKLLHKAWQNGTVMSGLSAGSICWFKAGNSDSRKFKHKDAALIKVTGLGFINGFICPHYDAEKERKPSLKKMVEKSPKTVALALDNCAAIEIIDDQYRIITSNDTAKAYKVYRQDNKHQEQEIPESKSYAPIDQLTTKN